MAYDSQSNRVILFGGLYAGGSGGCYGPDNTWAYDFESNTWTDMAPITKPPTLVSHAMAYDSQSDRVILFGGCSARSYLNDTWAYDFESNTWTDMAPAVKPPARIYHAMAYDAQSDRMILFGGYDGGSAFYNNDTWAYDFNTNTWTNMTQAAEPPARYLHAMAYDSQSDRVILFGGSGTAGYLNDTWAYDFESNTWTDMAPVGRPPARLAHAMAYDSQSDRVILFGGSGTAGLLNDARAYDFEANTWRDMNPTVRPPARYWHAMAYDSQSDRVILFGGSDNAGVYLKDTWSYDFDTNLWANMAVRPLARYDHALAYDSQSDRTILFGGIDDAGAFLNDTWAYDLGANTSMWTYMTPTPPARYGHAMAYDSQSDRVILFGGHGNANYLYFNDTWAYDFETNTWTDMDPAVKPPARVYHAMAYDSQSDRIVMLGGADGPSWFNDTWAYDFEANTWTDLNPVVKPPARGDHTMAYDSESDRVILFGGIDGANSFNDTWAYDLEANTWTDMAATANPPARHLHAMAYDSASDRVIVFAGYSTIGYGDDTWVYDLNANTWTDMAPITKAPTLAYHAMAYDSQSDRVILFGGASAYGYIDDTWAYDLEANSWTNVDVPLPLSAPQVLRVTPGNAQVTLTWQAPASNGGSPITGYYVYRGTAPGGLTLLSSLGDVLSYQDLGVTNGIPYYYQVSALTTAGEGPRTNEVTVTPHTQPSGPRNLVATPSATQVVLTWDSPISDGGAPVTGYSIYRGTALGSSALLATVGDVLTYADETVTNGATYYYQTAALNIAGEGPRSNEVSATPTAAPDSTPPTATVGSLQNNTVVNSTTITLTGTASDNVAIEKVEVSLDGLTWVPATGTTSWSATLTLAEGSNTIFVRTTDTSGNVVLTTITVMVDLTPLTPSGTPTLALDRVAGGAVVTTAVVVGAYVASSVGAGTSGASTASGGLTHRGLPLPWKRVMKFLRRRKRGAPRLEIHDRLFQRSTRAVERPNPLFALSKSALKASKVLAEVAPSLGLKVRGPWLFGRYRGFPVVVKESGLSDHYELLFQLALAPEAVSGAATAISSKEQVKSSGLTPSGLRIDTSVAELVYDHTPIVRTKAADVVRILEALANLAAVGGPPLGDRCAKCRQNPAGDVVVVNGLPTQLCPTDFEGIRGLDGNPQTSARGLRPSYAKGIGFGLAGMLFGSMIWSAIGIVTGYVLSLAAFGISIVIAKLLAKGAGRVTMSLVGLMVVFSMFAIFLGDVIWVGVVFAHLSGPLDLWRAVGAYVTIVQSDPYVLLSYVSGLVGILVSVGSMRRRARRERAAFEVIS